MFRRNNKRHREVEEEVEVPAAVVSAAASFGSDANDNNNNNSVVKELPTPVVSAVETANKVPSDSTTSNNKNKRLKKQTSSSSSVADDLLCPITFELPIEPVTAEDGRIYERTAIEEYFRRCHHRNHNNNRRRRISRRKSNHHRRSRSSSSSSTTTITIVKSPMTNQCMGTRLLPAIQTRNLIESLINQNLIDDKDLILSWKQRRRRFQQQLSSNNNNSSLLYTSHYKSIRTFREHETRIMNCCNIQDSNSILEHHQPEITYTMRSILIDWLIEIDYKFRCPPSNIHLTVNLVDRYLAAISSTKHILSQTKLQLVGVTCFWIATKYTTTTTTTKASTASSTASSTTPKQEETITSSSSSNGDDDLTNIMIHPPDIDDLVYICSNAYERSQILKMERKINKVLQLQQLQHPSSSPSNNNSTMLLLLPNDKDFLDGLLYALDHHDKSTATTTANDNNNRIRHLTRLILDGILFNCHLLYDRQYRRSDIITAAFYIAYCSCNNNNNNNGCDDDTSIREGNNNNKKNSWWNSTLQQYTNYSSIKDLLSIAHEVLLSHQKQMKRNTRIHTSLNAIEKKYSKVQYGQVANIQLIIIDDDDDHHDNENNDHRHSSSLASSLSSSCIIS